MVFRTFPGRGTDLECRNRGDLYLLCIYLSKANWNPSRGLPA